MSNMNIAQALRKIKKLKGYVSELRLRASRNVSYVVDQPPTFKFNTDIKTLVDYGSEILDLESKVAVANATNTIVFEDRNINLATAIRILQDIKSNISFFKNLDLKSGEVKGAEEERWSSEKEKYCTFVDIVKYETDLSEETRETSVKDLQDKFERLNNIVESANHQILI